ncbi:fumarylacetoacetase [Aurantiacibacter gangjinensis]|uniref:fumarylacetoacetase n=1 Tax=Aurantiacibacter gangjinensis TaxID=502682 RepID=A0A0G9MMW8_9SPHN|nr:fumarylacetoacetase [Aurantiacibacter gangjinensis]APE28132.1 Fumarylacetoacetase [Aurantiacibacter gangjinensis]KLE32050.1 fumarylacetoacetase [Aurantiacibacter gangjinensis]
MTRPTIDHTHNAAATSWVEGANGHPDFPVQNLPFGVFSTDGEDARGCVAISDFVLDLRNVYDADLMEDGDDLLHYASLATLNDFFAMPNGPSQLRAKLFAALTDDGYKSAMEPCLVPMEQAHMHLPFEIRDYTDFYTGIHHAVNIGSLFRPDNPLLPNYKHVPIGYHGRASSIRVSGTDVKRPSGQQKPAEEGGMPEFGPSKRLDYELEMAIWIGQGNELGDPIPVGEAEEHIAGISILNDWSARDIQAWEYQPLGPFLAKNFASTVSPWVVTMDALAPYRTAQPARAEGDPEPLPYLQHDTSAAAFGVTMEVHLTTPKMRQDGDAPFRLSKGPMTAMYWTAAQLVAHHSVGGCNMQPGDLLGTGTLTSGEEGGEGSLIELTEGGKKAITLPNGETRTFLEDGDEVVMVAYAEKDGFARIGLGECRAVITR